MAKNKKKRRNKKLRATDTKKPDPTLPTVVLVAHGPGFQGFIVPLRPDLGVHDANTLRSNMIRILSGSAGLASAMPESERPGPQLDSIAAPERAALLRALAVTVCRAEYHDTRFWKVTRHLAERRQLVGAPLAYDAFVPAAVFEAAGALSAARTVVDEVVHIAARRHGKTRWKVSDAMKETNESMKVPEVVRLRERAKWYDALNNYRNVIHHRGWKGDAAAYFPPGASELEAADPERNLLLAPDLDSLSKDARQHEWRYAAKNHLENVVRESLDGMREFIDAICLEVWGGRPANAGTAPPETHPTIIVHYPRPIPCLGATEIYLPVFSSEQLARAVEGYPPGGTCRLASLPLLTALFPEPAFALSIADLEPFVAANRSLTVLVDPASFVPLRARLIVPVPAPLYATAPFVAPLGVPKSALGINQLICWQQWR